LSSSEELYVQENVRLNKLGKYSARRIDDFTHSATLYPQM